MKKNSNEISFLRSLFIKTFFITIFISYIISIYNFEINHFNNLNMINFDRFVDVAGLIFAILATFFAWYAPYRLSKKGKVYRLTEMLDYSNKSTSEEKELLRNFSLSWFSLKAKEYLEKDTSEQIVVSWNITKNSFDNKTSEKIQTWLKALNRIQDDSRHKEIIRYLLIDPELLNEEKKNVKDKYIDQFSELCIPFLNKTNNGFGRADYKINFIRLEDIHNSDICKFVYKKPRFPFSIFETTLYKYRLNKRMNEFFEFLLCREMIVVQVREDTEGSDSYMDIAFSMDTEDIKNVNQSIKKFEETLYSDNKSYDNNIKQQVLRNLTNERIEELNV